MRRKKLTNLIIFLLLALSLGLIGYKVFVLGYTYADLIPQTSYTVELLINFTGNGEDLLVRTYLPANDQTQFISDELASAPNLNFRRDITPLYVRGEWSQYEATGPYQISYSFSAQIRSVKYNIDPLLRIPDNYPQGFEQYLKSTDVIQLKDPLIVELSAQLSDKERLVKSTLTNIYNHVLRMGSRPFKGTTDAVTAAKLGEASCNGKSRLFVALAREAGIPARLVGGLILNSGSKRTSHQWVEAYVAGYWIPFDALNGHYAALPGNFLTLYRGDEALFVHSRNIGFDYRYNIKKTMVTNNRLAGFLGGHGFNLYKILHAFKRVNISLNILTFLLVIPLGVLVVVVSRNILGINTFGTFLPALMAIAARGTGLIPGIIGFVFVLIVTVLIRYPLNKLGILHTPKMAVMMVVVIFSLLALTVLSDISRIDALTSIGAVSLFPIAILTITAERLAITLEEDGLKSTVKTMFQTLIVMSACYLTMNSVGIQALMLAFPELLLGVVAMDLWIGRWTGLRVAEMIRFRSLYSQKGGVTDNGS